jgi:hypothetical protein
MLMPDDFNLPEDDLDASDSRSSDSNNFSDDDEYNEILSDMKEFEPRRRPASTSSDSGSAYRRPSSQRSSSSRSYGQPDRAPQRRSTSQGSYSQRSSYNRRRKKKSGPPPLLYLLIFVVILIIVICISVSSCNSHNSSATPSASGTASASDTTSAEASATADGSAPAASLTDSAAADSSVQSAAVSSETAANSKSVDGLATESLGGVLVVGDSGYEYYNFVTSTANEYIDIVNNAATSLKGTCNVYDMIIPTSIAIMLPDSFTSNMEITVSNQKDALDYFKSSFNSDVKSIDIYDTMMQHNNEYIYFRTDHHWTALGAYYAYQKTAEVAGFSAMDISKFTKKSYSNFLGSFYADSDQDQALTANPDTVDCYIPPYSTTLNATQNDGTILEDWPLIADGDSYDSSMKYNVFIAGDEPYEEITNNDATTSNSCIVVKESFGNCFVPYLTANYKTVYVVDYRYWSGKVQDLAKDKGVSDVYIINNISMTRGEALVSDLSTVF